MSADGLHQQDNIHTRFGVQIASRLVGKDNSGLCSQCTGNRYTLLLTARQVIRHIFELLFQTERMNDLPNKLRIGFRSVNLNRVHNIFVHIEDGEQIVILKDKADIPAAEDR